MLAAITGPSFQPAFFVSIQFCSPGGTPATVNVWTGYGSLTTTFTGSSVTWTGLGSLLSIGQVEEGSTVVARSISLGFSGLDPTLLPDALTENQLGLPVNVWLAAMSGGAPIANPILVWSGATDQARFEIGPDTVELTIDCESILTTMDVPVDRRYNQQDQQMTYPGDVGFQFVYDIIDINIPWGSTARAAAGAAGSNAV